MGTLTQYELPFGHRPHGKIKRNYGMRLLY